jgi:hypothetical protein
MWGIKRPVVIARPYWPLAQTDCGSRKMGAQEVGVASRKATVKGSAGGNWVNAVINGPAALAMTPEV